MDQMPDLAKQEIMFRRYKIDQFKQIILQLQRLPFSPAVEHEIQKIQNEIFNNKNYILKIYHRYNFHPLDIVLL